MARTLLDVAREDYLRDRCDLGAFEARVARLLAEGIADVVDPANALRDEIKAAYAKPSNSARIVVLP